MNLYLDTSALVKLYVFEKGTKDVQSDVKRARMVATSSAAYPEARAAFARREREGGISADDLRCIVQDLDGDWGSFVVVELTSRVALLAGELAERYALRGFDAVHLASALEFGQLTGLMPGFSCYDVKLTEAAITEGLSVFQG